MRNYNPYLEAELMGAWFAERAGKLPEPVTESELQQLDALAQANQDYVGRDLARLVAEARALRAQVQALTLALSSDLALPDRLRG